MHHHAIADQPGQRREWLHVGLPENPLCWLLGHSPRARVMGTPVDERGVGFGEWELIDCRWCGRRYHDPNPKEALGGRPPYGDREAYAAWQAESKALVAARIANLKRMGSEEFCRSVERRAHWATAEAVLHHETHWPARGASRVGRRSYGFRFHLGNRSSETPIDGHLQAGPFAVYYSVGGLGGRLAGWLGRGHKRDLALHLDFERGGADLRWKLWYDGESGNDEHHRCDSWRKPKLWPWSAGRRKSRQWMCLRDGHLELNPLDAFYGHRLFHYEKLGEVRHALVTVGEFAGDEYLVDFTLERQTRHRDHGPRWARGPVEVDLVADWSCKPGGIPVRNHDWKGDTVLASGCSLSGWTDPGEDWLPYAVAEVVKQIKRDRRHYGYVPRSSVDA